ncbi:transglycosylase domain-containing protein, partial [Pseudomonas aeruginosa]|uniref:transglycosylase domain-containing protein n=1 Tax=Pseudomonas aeruginosa TaxID=287 RepID=UPI003EBDB7AF
RLDPRLITMISSPNGEQRLFVPRSGFPDLLVDTLLATEDRHFYEHDGISLYSIGRGVLANLTAGRNQINGFTERRFLQQYPEGTTGCTRGFCRWRC